MLALRLTTAAACLMALLACAGAAGPFATTEEGAPTSLPPLKNDGAHLEAACSVCAHGAKADGVHDDGPAVQAALASCSEVVIPATGCCGTTAAAASRMVFLVGPVVIPSDRTLRIFGSVSTLPPERWPLVQNKSLADCTVKTCMYRHLFNATGASNITVTGSGTIEGGGPAWWHLFAEGKLRAHRPMLVHLGGDNLTLSDITIHNPPMEAASLCCGSKHRVHGYRARVDIPGLLQAASREIQPRRTYESANAACLMLSDASDVHVVSVHLVCGDDNIAMNAGSREFKNVVIENSYFGWGHGCSIGSMTQAGLRNITVRNSVWNATSAGIRVKSYVGGGGDVQISARNLSMHGVENPIDLDQHYGGAKPPCMPHCDATKKPVYNVEVLGMNAEEIPTADLGPYLNGSSGPTAIVLTVSDSTFTTADGKPALWRCKNAHVIARNVSPMPGTCPLRTKALDASGHHAQRAAAVYGEYPPYDQIDT